jgi:hypothetical protein
LEFEHHHDHGAGAVYFGLDGTGAGGSRPDDSPTEVMVVDAGILDPDGSGAGPSEAANSRPSIRAGWMEIGEIMPGKHPAEIPTATAFWFLGCASLSCGGDNQRMLNPTSSILTSMSRSPTNSLSTQTPKPERRWLVGAGFQPVMSGKQFGKNLPQLLGSN